MRRPEILWPLAAPSSAPPGPRPLVLDTNIVLDLLLFADPGVAPLPPLLAQGQLRWLGSDHQQEELSRVLRYPQLQPALQSRGMTDAQLLAAYTQRSQRVPAPSQRAPWACRDSDDQPFIDLAVAHRAVLLSKDKAVLALARHLRTLGVEVAASLRLANPVEGAASLPLPL